MSQLNHKTPLILSVVCLLCSCPRCRHSQKELPQLPLWSMSCTICWLTTTLRTKSKPKLLNFICMTSVCAPTGIFSKSLPTCNLHIYIRNPIPSISVLIPFMFSMLVKSYLSFMQSQSHKCEPCLYYVPGSTLGPGWLWHGPLASRTS